MLVSKKETAEDASKATVEKKEAEPKEDPKARAAREEANRKDHEARKQAELNTREGR